MSKTVNLSLKVPQEIHQKLKVISALSGKSMSQIIIDFVIRQKITIPEFDEKTINIKPERKKTITTDEEAIKATITTCRDKGMSYQQISDKLEADGVSTLSGKGSWNKSTVAKLVKKWKNTA